MMYKELSNGINIPLLGIGTFPLKGEELKTSILSALKEGYTLIDCAISYGNEDELGSILSENESLFPSNILLTSKVDCWTLAGHKEKAYTDGISLNDAFEKSCSSLKRNKIDIYMLHQPFKFIANKPDYGYIEAYKELMLLRNEKRIEIVGVSNFGINDLERVYSECGEYPLINEIEISPYNTASELVDFCKRHNIHIEAYSPFGRGNLISELQDNETLKSLAKKYNKTVFQIILKWLVQQEITVIVRSKNESRIKQNKDIFDFELNVDEISAIDGLNRNITFGANKIK